jgi:hypothetical protein
MKSQLLNSVLKTDWQAYHSAQTSHHGVGDHNHRRWECCTREMVAKLVLRHRAYNEREPNSKQLKKTINNQQQS